jgi:L-galactose dehydrogenase
MEYRPLGKTDLRVSVMALGGAAIGQQYGSVSVAEAADTVHAGIDAGVNLIDTTAYYRQGVSEQILGEVLQGGWRDKVLICTKAGRLDRAMFDFSPDGMEKCLDGSLSRLKVDHVDILLAHDIEFAKDYEFVFNETAAVLHKLKQKGKCRFVGMSCYPLGLLRQAIEQCNLDVVISYCHFNLQNQQLLTDLLPVVDRHGIGILNASPLGMGLMTNQGPPPWHPAPEAIKAACRDAAKLCRDRGADISFLGMQYCFAEARIPSTITGTAKKDELDVNLKALTTPIDPALLADVQKVLEPVSNQTWPGGNWVGEPRPQGRG